MVTVFHADDAQPTNKDSRRQPACLGSALQNKESLSSCQQACFIDSHPRHTIDTNSNDGEDNKSSGEPITSNDSLLAARDLCDTAHTTHTRRNYRVNKWYPAPPPQTEQGAFVCHSGQSAKPPDSLEHAIHCQPGGARFVDRTAVAQTRRHALTNNPPAPKCKVASSN